MKRICAILSTLALSAYAYDGIDLWRMGAAARQNSAAQTPVVYHGAAVNRTNSVLISAGDVAIGVTNAWTLMAWVKLGSVGNNYQNIFQVGAGFVVSGPSTIKLVGNADSGALDTYLYIRDASNTVFRYYTYKPIGTQLVNMAVTWDGTTLNLYSNGVAMTATAKPTDNAGSMANDSRKIFLGAASNNNGTTIVDRVQGQIYGFSIYSYALAATAIAAIVSAQCTSPAGSPNHNFYDYQSSPSLFTNAIGAWNLNSSGTVTEVTTVLSDCP